MNGKHVSLAALILAVVVTTAVRAQNPQGPETLPQPRGYPNLDSGGGDGTGGPDSVHARSDAYGAPGQAGGERVPPDPVAASPGLSRYITYAEADCCRVGGNGPIGMELFFRTGPAFGIGGGVFAHTLKTGWRFEGGGRSLFFDEDRTAAWTTMLSLSQVSYGGQHADTRIRLNGIIVPRPPQNPNQQQLPQAARFPVIFVTTSYLSTTFVNGSVGRDWFLWGAAGCEGTNLRFGVDLGGRWGSARFGSHELRNRTDVVGGVFGGAQLLYETPCGGCCIFHAGLRLEYDYIWSDVLQAQNNADLTNINLLMQAGFRY